MRARITEEQATEVVEATLASMGAPALQDAQAVLARAAVMQMLETMRELGWTVEPPHDSQ